MVCWVDTTDARILQRCKSRLILKAAGYGQLTRFVQVSSSAALDTGAEHLYNLSYLYGFLVSAGLYCVLSRTFPAKEAYVTDGDIVESASAKAEYEMA